MGKIKSALSTLEAYPLSAAQNCISRYVERATTKYSIPQENVIRAYSVKSSDVVSVLNITGEYAIGYENFRAYIGIESVTVNGREFNIDKLFLVPIGDDGKDVILEDPSGNKYVYDFNTPCPNTCDNTSPLYLAGTDAFKHNN